MRVFPFRCKIRSRQRSLPMWRRTLFVMTCCSIVASADIGVLAMPADTTASIQWKKGRETGLPIPRFVSLKAKNARMRVGPSQENPVKWLYTAPGLPVEIIEEFGNWRQIRDCDGVSGWMHRSLLSGRRTAVIGPWIKTPVALSRSASPSAQGIALLSAKVRLNITSCQGAWCRVVVPHHDLAGYVRRTALCGIFPFETIPN
ncbi:SH3-like domain-containing protein [Rhizobium sp. 9140]|nr:SH3-like domain-containing protein [Rhizobium sp. 9140]